MIVAERQGFEPWRGCPQHAFQACALSRSATSPFPVGNEASRLRGVQIETTHAKRRRKLPKNPRLPQKKSRYVPLRGQKSVEVEGLGLKRPPILPHLRDHGPELLTLDSGSTHRGDWTSSARGCAQDRRFGPTHASTWSAPPPWSCLSPE